MMVPDTLFLEVCLASQPNIYLPLSAPAKWWVPPSWIRGFAGNLSIA